MRISDWSADVCSSDLGHGVVRARNGQEALQLANGDLQFDLVFTDVVMPGMTGLELASKLKQQNPRLPIILTTGYSDRIVSAGSEGYPLLPKPYRLETLAATLDKVLAAHKKSGRDASLQRTRPPQTDDQTSIPLQQPE